MTDTSKYKICQPFTRAVQKEFNKIIFTNSVIEGKSTKLDPNQIDPANDYLVRTLYWITQEEVDSMDPDLFEELLKPLVKSHSPTTQG